MNGLECFIISFIFTIFVFMETLMRKFLDHLNPNTFLVETKFGCLPHYEGTIFADTTKRQQVWLLCDFFSCEYNDGLEVYDRWLSSKPVYVRIYNSTTEFTYVPKTYSNYTTV